MPLSSKRPDDSFRLLPVLSLLAVLWMAGCGESKTADDLNQQNAEIVCAPDNGGITLPDGFCASLVVDSLGLGDDVRSSAIPDSGLLCAETGPAASSSRQRRTRIITCNF